MRNSCNHRLNQLITVGQLACLPGVVLEVKTRWLEIASSIVYIALETESRIGLATTEKAKASRLGHAAICAACKTNIRWPPMIDDERKV